VADDAKTFGPNDWLVEEMYDRFRTDPNSVSKNWQDFFADNFRPEAKSRESIRDVVAGRVEAPAAGQAQNGGNSAAAAVSSNTQAASTAAATNSASKAAGTTALPVGAEPKPLRGVGARIVENMEASLSVPTATSVRTVPAKLLEVNRSIINNHLRRTRNGKISFTHIIAYAVVEALRTVPNMANYYAEIDGTPHVVRPESVGLGLAVDVEKKDGARSLLVPCIKGADRLDFKGFWTAYDEIIRKIKTNKISPEDFAGVNITITNPGTIGTVHSVPRLMPGQGLILGVGAIDFPSEFEAADRRALANLGVSKVVTLTSTYDHRIIQGAESGMFLKKIHDLLTKDEEFWDAIFRSLKVPYEPARWHADTNPLDDVKGNIEKQAKVWNLINMYRVRGHLIADLDPLAANEPHTHSELDPVNYGLSIWDNDREFYTGGLAGKETETLGAILGILRDAYCRQIGVEYMHIQNPDEKSWIQQNVEGVRMQLDSEEQRWVLSRLNAAEAFEKFLHTRYVGQKRFGLEGAESTVPMIETVLNAAAEAGVGEAVMGMAHRGRLNMLINVLGKKYGDLFSEFEGNINPDTPQGSGDVKYHKGYSSTYTGRSGNEIKLSLAPNPSHLEAVDPVVEGMVRAKQDCLDWTHDDDAVAYPVLPILIHGDAAFAGQGVVAETLNMSALRGYRTGGTVHLVIDNQVGFTTNPESARSTVYATDVAKMVQAPIFHVNGDDPEACVRVAKLAFEYRQRFHKDAVLHVVCYRRFGHNEGDEPSYTQPQMYERIDARRSVRKLYTETLISRGDMTLEEAEKALDDFSAILQTALDETRSSAPPKVTTLPPLQHTLTLESPLATGVDKAVLDSVADAVHAIPQDFTVHPKLAKQLETRAKLYVEGEVDWALGEAFAFGSLLLEGKDVRIAGQDSRRGTFSHRHATLIDYSNGSEITPLADLVQQESQGQGRQLGRFFIYDSFLSEYAALGFEFGYSISSPNGLTVWEAQFGDFVNGAQIIIDQFIAASKDKWNQTSNLTMMLPHGYEGQGPEHSSARLERFLELAANENMRIVNLTTSAQHFHALRRQVLSERKLPLIIMSPKSGLRAKTSRSNISEFTNGTFQTVLDDQSVGNPEAVDRIVLCSGKVAFDAMARRDETGAPAAIVRVEQLYPWPDEPIKNIVARYPNAREVVWLQEEPKNMGPWRFVLTRLPDTLGERLPVRCVARMASGSPATGTVAMHNLELNDLMNRTFQ
jgi:2-oxoglutarate decarboxylase